MITVQDWIAAISEEDKHIAYVGEGMSETREFFLTGQEWQTYRDWAFHLDMAFDPESITTRDSRQVVQTTSDSTEHAETATVTTEAVTTKETYTVHNVQVEGYNLTDVASLDKTVEDNGVRLTWTVLRQHTQLPGKLWATIRAVGDDPQHIKKSAIMVFEVDPAIIATPAAMPPVSEFERMEAEMDALRQQSYAAAQQALQHADDAASAAEGAIQAVQQAEASVTAATQQIALATTAAEDATTAAQLAITAYTGAEHHAQAAKEAAEQIENSYQEAQGVLQAIVPRLLPTGAQTNEGNLLQMVNGTWTMVAVADSSVKTYVEQYIGEALGGEY